jgi:biotin carboxyl carrier protein
MDQGPGLDGARPVTPDGADQPAAPPGEALARALSENVRAVLRVLRGTTVEEFRLERGGHVIALRRIWDDSAHPAAVPAPETAEAGADVLSAPAGINRLATPGRVEVRALAVGIFHRARADDAPPLANEGDVVEAESPIGVVETLGIANDVRAPRYGILAEFTVLDGQPVEYGELIAVIVAEE